MAYKCIRGAVTSNGPIAPNDIIDLPANEARELMANGKIVPHDETVIATASIEVDHRDPKPRGRKKSF